MIKPRHMLLALAALLGLLSGVETEQTLGRPHRPSARAQAIIDGRTFADENDISDR